MGAGPSVPTVAAVLANTDRLISLSLAREPMPPNYRRCISCRQVAPKSSLWRVVRRHPDGKVQLDQGMGRSAYLCPRADCLRQAERKNRLGRSLRVNIPTPLFAQLWQRLTADPDMPPGLS